MPIGDLAHYVRTYDDDMTAEQCRQFMASFDGLARFQAANGRGVKPGLDGSAWTELNVTRFADPPFLAAFKMRIERALDRYNRDVGLTIPVPQAPTNSDLMMKRYRAGQDERFQLHFDSIYAVSNRYMVMLWYLNDVDEGGETAFPQLDLSVRPKAGRLLMFPPFWMYQHEGVAPRSGDKYIISCYLLFGDTPTGKTTAM